MSAFRIPVQACDGHRLRQHRLAVCRPGKRGGIETREGVERIAFDVCSGDGGIQKSKVEGRIVSHQN